MLSVHQSDTINGMSHFVAPVLDRDALTSIVDVLARVCDGDGVEDLELLPNCVSSNR